MKHIYHTLLVVLLLGMAHSVQAQITLTEDYFLSRIGTTENSVFFELEEGADFSAIVNATGPNQTWDFSGYAIIDTASISQTYIQLPADVPGADLFPDASFAIQLESDTVTATVGDSVAFFLFSTLSDGYFLSNGGVTLADLDEDGATDDLLVTTFSPASKENPLPLNYEDTWDDSTTVTLSFGEFEFPATSADITTSVVDGWGTLITPEGSFQALRIKTEFYARDLMTGIVEMTHTDIEIVSMEGTIGSLFIDASDGEVLGSYSVSDTEMSGTSVGEEEGLPSEFQLSQNYPNPFNPSTTIRYELPAVSDVTLRVFTLTGQEVSTLVNATQGVGSYEVQFDASNLASGLYLYRLETGSFSETRLMSLIK